MGRGKEDTGAGAKQGVAKHRKLGIEHSQAKREPPCAPGQSATETVTNLNEAFHPAGHGEFFTVSRPRLLGHHVLWQTPAFLYHELLKGRQTQEPKAK